MAQNDFMLTPEELFLVRRKRRRRLVLVVGLVVLAIVIAIFARPASHAIKSWQSRRHAARALVLIDQEKWREARDAATDAIRLKPDEPQALRAVARLLSRANQQPAFEFWKKLDAIEPLTQADLRDEATLALKTNDLTTADATVQRLLKTDKPSAADLLLAADLAGRKLKFEKASEFARKALADPALNRRQEYEAVFILETILRNGGARFVPDPKLIDDRMASLARGVDDVALDALIVLSQFVAAAPPGTEEPSPIPVEELVRRLDDHPFAKLSHRLLAADVEIRQQPDRRIWVEEREIARCKDCGDQDLANLAAWLYKHGEYQRALDVVPVERALKSRELFLQSLDTLGALGRWSDVKTLLDREHFPLEPVIQLMYLARCNAQLGEKTAAANNWKRALEAAHGDTAKLIVLADYAEKNGIADAAVAAYEEAAAEEPKLWIAQQGRLRIAQHSRETAKIRAVLADMLQVRPDDPAVQNEEAYTRLLLLEEEPQGAVTQPTQSERPGFQGRKEKVESIEALARKLLASEPDSLPHRTLLALALLKQNRPQDALALYDGVNASQNELTPSAVVVHAAILAANSREADARIEVSHLPKEKLLPEERALVNQL
jgi:tetratricopeptide (TPR) repeat protein